MIEPTAGLAISRAPNSHSGEKKEVDYRGHGQSEYDRNPHNYTLPVGTRRRLGCDYCKRPNLFG
jgi:hypothetical protein